MKLNHGWRACSHGNAFSRLGSCGGVAFELVPDLDDHFPRDGHDGDVPLAFAGKEFPAPFPQRTFPTHAKHGVGSLDEEVAQVAPPALADAHADVFAVAALPLAGA